MCTGLEVRDGEEMVFTRTECRASREERQMRITVQGWMSPLELPEPRFTSIFPYLCVCFGPYLCVCFGPAVQRVEQVIFLSAWGTTMSSVLVLFVHFPLRPCSPVPIPPPSTGLHANMLYLICC